MTVTVQDFGDRIVELVTFTHDYINFVTNRSCLQYLPLRCQPLRSDDSDVSDIVKLRQRMLVTKIFPLPHPSPRSIEPNLT